MLLYDRKVVVRMLEVWRCEAMARKIESTVREAEPRDGKCSGLPHLNPWIQPCLKPLLQVLQFM